MVRKGKNYLKVMMERGDKLLEISGALEYMQNRRIDDVTTLIENVTLTNKKGKAVKRCTYTLYMTEARNLNRIYCNEHIKGKAVMPLDIAQTGIKSTFERAIKEGIDYVEILFHGGEPFMAFPQIKEICEWLWAQTWPTKYICYATTNGTLIHGAIKDWSSHEQRKRERYKNGQHRSILPLLSVGYAMQRLDT